MDQKSIFNVTVCTVGTIFLVIHIIDLLLKKDRRKDEKNLLTFFVFTAVHLFAYLSFTIVKVYYTSNALIMTAYSLFYLANNIEVLLLFAYAISYVELNSDVKRASISCTMHFVCSTPRESVLIGRLLAVPAGLMHTRVLVHSIR